MPIYRERQPGIYRCRFTGTREVEFTDKDTGEPVHRWDWIFQEVGDQTSMGTISRLTSQSLVANSNALKFFAGLKGGKPESGEDSDAYIGVLCDVVYGLNQAGNLAITNVIRVVEGAGDTPLPPQTAQDAPGPAKAEGVEDLPF